MRDNILEKHRDASLAVYVVWLPMLGPDSRAAVNTDVLDDPRVVQFWDEERVVGRWLAEAGVGGGGASGVVWDAYYLFGPGAQWDERPGPVAGFGEPVIASSAALEREAALQLARD